MLNPDGSKRCPRCGETKPAGGNFYRVKKSSDGYAGYCKACTKAKVIEWQKANPEKKAAQDKVQSAKPHKKKYMREYKREYAKKNPEKLKGYQTKYIQKDYKKYLAMRAAWRDANRDKLREAQRKYHQTERFRELSSLRGKLRRGTARGQHRESNGRVRKRYGIEGATLTAKEWAIILEQFNGACAYCGRCDVKITVDHIEPLINAERRGEPPAKLHCAGNVVPACLSCNSRKRARTLESFAQECGIDADEIRARARLPGEEHHG